MNHVFDTDHFQLQSFLVCCRILTITCTSVHLYSVVLMDQILTLKNQSKLRNLHPQRSPPKNKKMLKKCHL